MLTSCLLAAALLAHNPDTSYARLTITPEKVHTRLTYDVFTLLKITPLDDNANNRLERTELEAHAPYIAEFLRAKIGLATSDEDETADLGDFSGFVWPPDIGAAIPAAEYHTANGLIHFDFTRTCEVPPEVVAVAFGFFPELTERHTILGVFVCNGQEYETSFTSFEDNFEYTTGFPPPPPAAPGEVQRPAAPQTQRSLAESTWRFFKMGVRHILEGYDHICFLIALIIVSRFRQIVKIVTSFTIAHSITLILAALDIVRLPTRVIEAGIAATIVYVAVENLWLVWRRGSGLGTWGSPDRESMPPRAPNPESRVPTAQLPATSHRWRLTFFFGLIHGFGFANVLRELGLPTTGLIQCLLAFNVGVEAGQLAIAILLLPLALFLQRWRQGPKLIAAISALLALFGVAWFADRAFNLQWMPF